MTVKSAAPVLVGALLVGGLGAVHGVSTDRWGPSGQLQEASASLDRLPPAFGDWTGEDVPYEPEDMARAGIHRCVVRLYTNRRTREAVSALVVCGRGGPISVHTPDVCYSAGGYRQVTDATVRTVVAGGGTHPFRVARFAKTEGASPAQLEVFWAWSRDGQGWDAPDNPRVTLARAPALYKFYVVREFLPGTRAEAADVCGAFLARAIPEFRAALSPG
ncbi:hypothetical protein ETAA1_61610 [Urbifossiella limnaea]|uniref:Methanolan biosynthesis EpsI domain-containing protein n=2 Tax=Urbifossiella limnaea TaxID=2528023 RepID=A0A517Y332_9BACT|nr:hypothetical protein ETAA1_61610 [Urbifossiella limnaea]